MKRFKMTDISEKIRWKKIFGGKRFGGFGGKKRRFVRVFMFVCVRCEPETREVKNIAKKLVIGDIRRKK